MAQEATEKQYAYLHALVAQLAPMGGLARQEADYVRPDLRPGVGLLRVDAIRLISGLVIMRDKILARRAHPDAHAPWFRIACPGCDAQAGVDCPLNGLRRLPAGVHVARIKAAGVDPATVPGTAAYGRARNTAHQQRLAELAVRWEKSQIPEPRWKPPADDPLPW